MNHLHRRHRESQGPRRVRHGRSDPGNGRASRRSRRGFLGATGTALAVALAGCTGEGPAGVAHGGAELPSATLRMEPVADAELPMRVLYTVGIDEPDRRAALMDDIIDGGTTIERTRPPFPDDRHLYYDDAVYQLSSEVVKETPATSYQIRVDIVQGTVTDSEAVQFADLPAVDREKFAAYGWDDGGTFGLGTSILYTHDEREESALVPDSEYAYILWEDGSEAAWFVDDSHETTLNTYEYGAERHSSATEYGRRMRDRFEFELSGLSDAEREIVETAIDEEAYNVPSDRTPTAAFQSLADRFDDAEPARGLDAEPEDAGSGGFPVRFEGELYWTVWFVRTQSEPPNESSATTRT